MLRTDFDAGTVNGTEFCRNADHKMHRRKKIIYFVIAVIAVVLVISALLILMLWNSDPMTKLSKSLDKVIFESEEISVQVSVTKDGVLSTYSGNVHFGEEIADSSAVLNRCQDGRSDGITVENGIIKTDEKDIVIEAALDGISDKLAQNGFSLDISVSLNRIINRKLDKDEFSEIVAEEIYPQLKGRFSSGPDISDEDYETLVNEFKDFLKDRDNEAFFTVEMVDTDEGKAYEYELDIGKLSILCIEFAGNNETAQKIIGTYCEAFWEDNPQLKLYGFYSAEVLKEQLFEFIERSVDADAELNGRFEIVRGRLTYFSVMTGDFSCEIVINSR